MCRITHLLIFKSYARSFSPKPDQILPRREMMAQISLSNLEAFGNCYLVWKEKSVCFPPQQFNPREVNHVALKDCTSKKIWEAQIVFSEKKMIQN